MQGAYVVWLPLEIAIIHRRTAGTGRQSLLTRRAAAVLVGPRGALVLSALLVALGCALWLPFNDSTGQALVNMAVAGLGSGHWSPRCRPPPRPRRHRSAPPSPPA